MLQLAVLLCSAAALAFSAQLGAAESLDFSRVHIVDANQATAQILFRSNFPGNATGGYDYPLLMSYLQNRTAQANLTWPSDPYLVVMSLNNPVEPEYWIEQAWWKDNAWAGELIQYVLTTSPHIASHALTQPTLHAGFSRLTCFQVAATRRVPPTCRLPQRYTQGHGRECQLLGS